METKFITINPEKPEVETIAKVAAAVDDGALAIFPTETVYGIACRVRNDSLFRLSTLKSRTPEKFYTLHLGNKCEISRYVPRISLKAEKIINKFLPGPLTIVLPVSIEDIKSLKGKLHAEEIENLYKGGSIGIRIPDNAVASSLLSACQKAVIAPSANLTGQMPACDASDAEQNFYGQVEYILNGGLTVIRQSSTVARIDRNGVAIIREGYFTKDQIDEVGKVRILFVCTGNTCRSPMAEGIFKKLFAEKLGCHIDQLESMGYIVGSAGVIGQIDAPASPEAVAVCKAEGVDISSHRSRALTKNRVEQSDLIFVMGRSHLTQVKAINPKAKCFLLAEDKEILDPVGQSQEVYESCLNTIKTSIQKTLDWLGI